MGKETVKLYVQKDPNFAKNNFSPLKKALFDFDY